PCKRVANPPIYRIWAIFRKANDVWLGFHSGKLPAYAGNACAHYDDCQPRRHIRMNAMGEKIEGEWTGRKIEHDNPDGPMRKTIMQLVALPDFSFAGVFEPNCDGRVRHLAKAPLLNIPQPGWPHQRRRRFHTSRRETTAK